MQEAHPNSLATETLLREVTRRCLKKKNSCGISESAVLGGSEQVRGLYKRSGLRTVLLLDMLHPPKPRIELSLCLRALVLGLNFNRLPSCCWCGLFCYANDHENSRETNVPEIKVRMTTLSDVYGNNQEKTEHKS